MWWLNQAIVFHSLDEIEGMEIGQTYIIKFIVQTEYGMGFILDIKPNNRIFLQHLFIPKLDYIEQEQQVFELFYNN